MSLDQLSKSSDPQTRSHRSLAWLLPIALLVGFLLIIALLFGSRLIPAVEVTTAPVITLRQESATTTEQIETISISKGSMLFQASGWVEPDPYITYVPTLINGVVDQVIVLEGHQVKKGDLLATLIDDDAKLNLQQAEQKIKSHQGKIDAHCQGTRIIKAEIKAMLKNIAALKTSLAEAEDTLRRYSQIPKGAIPQQKVTAARFAVTRAEAMVSAAEAELPKQKAQLEQIEFERISMTSVLGELETERDRVKLALSRTRISAPMDGVVLDLHAAPGKKRMLDMDDPKSAVIVELYDPNKLQARIDVPLTEAASMQIGQIVELTSDLLPDMVFKGKVTRITGEADLQRNTLQAKVSIENPDIRLRPEMLVRGKFFSTGSTSKSVNQSDSSRLALYVPKAALIDNNSVWVIDTDQKSQLRTITLGKETRENHHRVLEGLRSGEHVILPPHAKLKNGTRIKLTPNN